MADETQTPTPTPQAAPTPQPAPATKTEQTVPFDRFDRVIGERDTARSALTEALEARTALDARVKALEKVAGKAEEYRTQAESLQGRLVNTRAAAAFGIVEDDLIEAAESHWRKLPDTDRPAFADMLKDWREGNEGKPADDKIPFMLRPHLLGKWAPIAAEPAPATPKAPPAGHRAPGTAGPQGSQRLTAEQVNSLAADVRTGKIKMADYMAAVKAGKVAGG